MTRWQFTKFYCGRVLPWVIVTVLSADLLYLYHNGAWWDPIFAIEVAEIIMSCALFLTGIAATFLTIASKKREIDRTLNNMSHEGPD